MTRRWPPEVELILACARLSLDPTRSALVRATAGQALDWDLILRMAQTHAVTPLLWHNLARTAREVVPPDVMARLGGQVRFITRNNLFLVSRLLPLLREFQTRGIRVLTLKGPSLAAGVYRDLALRPFRDLDLLVHPRDVGRAHELLTGLGFRMGWFERGWEYHYERNGVELQVDLHERIAADYYPTPAQFDSLWERRRPVAIAGGAVDSIGPEDLLLILGVQLAKDCRVWKQRLIQVCDTTELIRGTPGMDWSFVLERARAMSGERIILLSLRLAQQLLEAELPPEVVARIAADPMVDRLSAEVAERCFPHAAGSSLALRRRADDLFADSGFHLRSRERTRDKLDYVWRYARLRLRRVVTPTDKDREFVTLPRGLGLLYYAVRPLRIVSDMTRRRGWFAGSRLS